MIHRKYDVTPSVENKGVTVRCSRNIEELEKLPKARQEKEIADLNAANSQAVAKYEARIADANARDLHTVTENGLPMIGPASSEALGILGMAHNHAMVLLDAKLAEINAKLSQLEASK